MYPYGYGNPENYHRDHPEHPPHYLHQQHSMMEEHHTHHDNHDDHHLSHHDYDHHHNNHHDYDDAQHHPQHHRPDHQSSSFHYPPVSMPYPPFENPHPDHPPSGSFHYPPVSMPYPPFENPHPSHPNAPSVYPPPYPFPYPPQPHNQSLYPPVSYPPPHSVPYPPQEYASEDYARLPPEHAYAYPPPEHTYDRPPPEHAYARLPSENAHYTSVPQHIPSFQEDKPSAPEQPPHQHAPPSSITHLSSDVELPKGQLVRVFCKANKNSNLAVKGARLMMVQADSENESQQWIRDDKYGIRVRDSFGHPAFMLINKACKKVLKHTKVKMQEVQLVDYNPGMQDDDLFWTESQDFGEGFKTVRMASDTLLNLSVLHGGGNEDGSSIILDTWHKKDNQLWKIFPL